MKRFFTLIATAVAVMILLTSAGAHAAENQNSYVFVAPVVEGFSVGSFDKLLKDAAAAVSAKTGIPFKLKDMKFRSGDIIPPKIINALKTGKGDFSYIYSQDYLKNPEVRNVVDPLFTMTLNNRKTADVCAYVRKADGISSLQQLKGKKWGMSSMIATYWLLYKNGINEDLPKFFSSIQYVADTPAPNILDALLAKKIDVFIVSNVIIDMTINNDAKYKAVQKLKCTEFDHNMLFVARKGLPAKDIEKIKAAFLGAHKDKQFQSFWFIFKAIKGHFVAFDPASLDSTKAIVVAATKNKWYDKENAFIKNYRK